MSGRDDFRRILIFINRTLRKPRATRQSIAYRQAERQCKAVLKRGRRLMGSDDSAAISKALDDSFDALNRLLGATPKRGRIKTAPRKTDQEIAAMIIGGEPTKATIVEAYDLDAKHPKYAEMYETHRKRIDDVRAKLEFIISEQQGYALNRPRMKKIRAAK